FNLRDTLSVLRRRKWVILLTTVVVFVVGAFMSYQRTPVYEATTTLLLRAPAQNSVLAEQMSGDPERRVQNESEVLKGERTSAEAAERLGFSAAVTVEAGGDSDVIEVTGSSSVPQEAADIANTYAEVHLALRQQDNLAAIDAARV